MKSIGDCPYCGGNVYSHQTTINGKKVVIYSCENYKVEFDEFDDQFYKSKDSTCSFRIFSNSLLKYNKRSISEKEVRRLLDDKEIIVRLYSKKLYNEDTKKYGSEYFKYAIPDEEYGIKILFELEVEK